MLETFFKELDDRGVVVVMSAGNHGYNKDTGKPDSYQEDQWPQQYVTDASPFIMVGATYHDGSIAEFTTPPAAGPDASGQSSNADAPSISIWAQGVGVYSCNLVSEPQPMGFHTGTSFAAPQVVSFHSSTKFRSM